MTARGSTNIDLSIQSGIRSYMGKGERKEQGLLRS